jgi:ABC-2 type transport system permease protein
MGAVSMRNVWLIARREYVERIRTKGFMITTIMIPLIMGGFIFGSIFLSSKAPNEVHIAVVSPDTQLALDLQAELERMQRQSYVMAEAREQHPTSPRGESKQPEITADAIDPSAGTRARLDQELDDNELDGYLWISPATAKGGRPSFEYTPRESGQGSVKNILAAALQRVLIREQLSHSGVVAAEADSMLEPVRVVVGHESHSDDRESAEVSVSVLFFVMYLAIMLYGMNVARSIIEEKTSRIFEVLLATVRPEAMMAGKIIGVGSVGLTQVGIWLAAALALAGTSVAVHLGGDTIHMSLTLGQVIFFFVYFILGYLFYASIAAALGAMTNSEQELQQLNMFLVMPLVVCFAALGTVLLTPDVMLSRVLALIPPFTPLLMYMRISLGHPFKWEIAASIVLMSASICGIIWVTSRIYRIGVLMYGKRPNIPEILRWLKYS